MRPLLPQLNAFALRETYLLCQYAFGGGNLALLMKSHVQVVVVFGGGNLALWKPTSGATVVWLRGTASWKQQCLTLRCQHQFLKPSLFGLAVVVEAGRGP